MIGSTVTEGVLHAEQVTVDVRAPANVWSTRQLAVRWVRFCQLTSYTVTARHLTFCGGVHLIKRGQEEGMRIYPSASPTIRGSRQNGNIPCWPYPSSSALACHMV